MSGFVYFSTPLYIREYNTIWLHIIEYIRRCIKIEKDVVKEGNVFIYFKNEGENLNTVLADTFKEYLKNTKINDIGVEKFCNRS